MKIYAKQVPPEYQESPLFLEEYDLENLYIFGNRNYNGLHTAAIDGFSCYCIAWDDSGIRQEIADAYGGRPEDVILYKFTGYSKIANYTEV